MQATGVTPAAKAAQVANASISKPYWPFASMPSMSGDQGYVQVAPYSSADAHALKTTDNNHRESLTALAKDELVLHSHELFRHCKAMQQAFSAAIQHFDKCNQSFTSTPDQARPDDTPNVLALYHSIKSAGNELRLERLYPYPKRSFQNLRSPASPSCRCEIWYSFADDELACSDSDA